MQNRKLTGKERLLVRILRKWSIETGSIDAQIGVHLLKKANWMLDVLAPNEAKVIDLRYGLTDGVEHSPEQIHELLSSTSHNSLTVGNIRTLEASGLKKLRCQDNIRIFESRADGT
ncbi:MAG: hypothetical protein ABR981_04400 [Candidatus Micrarchaeaceae archaeon]|jgi:DNA-directed RNA polymerase sigma subunit (sigma70/sigma32)